SEILAQGLSDGRRKVRSAAAQMLAQLGARGAEALPKMVQRLFERNPLVRDQVAPALGRLLTEISPELQRWLCLIANPLLPAEGNLRTVLDRSDLPDTVREEFAAVCARRSLWYDHVRQGNSGPAPLPEPGSFA